MNSIMTTINGSEDLTRVENDKLRALIRFYSAFIKLMKNVWLNTGEASMNNPVGGIIRGWNSKLSSRA